MSFLKGKIKPMYFRYLAAASGSALVASIFGMVDAITVGKYHGPSGTAALAVFSPFWTIVYSLGLLAGIGSSVLFANNRGKGDEKNAQEYFTVSIFYGTILSIAAMIGIGFFNEPLFRFFGADNTLLPLAQSYLAPIKIALPCCVFSNILSAWLRNDGNPVLATTAVMTGGVFNAFGDYFFVFAMDMGIFGAGLATAVGLTISVLMMLTHFVSKKNTLHFIKPTAVLRKVENISLTGFPTAINDLAMGIFTMLFNRQIMKYLGVEALAVYGVIVQVAAFAQCCAYGAGQAAQPIISQNFGAGHCSRIKECLKYGLHTCAAFGIFWTAITMFVPDLLVYIFMTPTEAVLKIAPGIIRAYGTSFLLLPINLFATYYFQAIMKAKISLASSLARSAFISGVMITVMPLIAGVNAIWYAMLVTEVLVAVFNIHYMVRCTRELKAEDIHTISNFL